MGAGPRFELERPRAFGEILVDALRLLGRHAVTFLGISLAIVAPVQLIVSGIGLEQLTGPYDADVGAAELAISTAVSALMCTCGCLSLRPRNISL